MVLLTPVGLISPGRFYVSIVAKMVLSHFIMNYDIKLANPEAPPSLAWSFAIVCCTASNDQTAHSRKVQVKQEPKVLVFVAEGA